MNTPDNRFKQALSRREPQIGLWLALANPYAAELVAGSGFDFLTIDGEHSPNTLASILATLQALAGYPVQPVVRVPNHDPSLLKQVLELGATTLLVPMVETPEEARQLVLPCGTRRRDFAASAPASRAPPAGAGMPITSRGRTRRPA